MEPIEIDDSSDDEIEIVAVISPNGTNEVAARIDKDQGPPRFQFKLFATVQDQQARRYGSSSNASNDHCQTLRQMLAIDHDHGSKMEWMVAANFLLDSQFLLDEIPELISCPKLIIFYEFGEPQQSWSNTEFIRITPRDEPSSPSRRSANPLKYKFPYGSHHTKMFLIGYQDRLRVIIHTANLTPVDIHKKAQGAYIQDFPMKSNGTFGSVSSSKSGDSKSNDFEQSLITYMDSYGYTNTHFWSESEGAGGEKITLMQQLSRYDYSSANAVLVPSVPGFYSLPDKSKDHGYLKLKNAIDKHTNKSNRSDDRSGHLICQFSSIGALSEKWLKEFVSSISIPQPEHNGGKRDDSSKKNLVDLVKLVYPTAEEIRTSIEGYPGGNSVPCKSKNLQRPFLKPLYCKWASTVSASSSGNGTRRDPIHKPNNVPHIKSYYQLTPDGSSMEWFVLGSHNLSKAAWGEVINGKYGKCLRVSSWELGVFVSPQLTGGRLVPCENQRHTSQDSQSSDTLVPLPYSKEPERYHPTDEPWAVDKVYNRADKFGLFSAMSMLSG